MNLFDYFLAVASIGPLLALTWYSWRHRRPSGLKEYSSIRVFMNGVELTEETKLSLRKVDEIPVEWFDGFMDHPPQA